MVSTAAVAHHGRLPLRPTENRMAMATAGSTSSLAYSGA